MFLRGAGGLGRILAAAKVLAGELAALACPCSALGGGAGGGGGRGGGDAAAAGFLFYFFITSLLLSLRR